MSLLNALLTGAIDFAGLFPPAAQEMAAAVRAYAGYRRGPRARFLGSFVVPAARLDEFRNEVSALPRDARGDRTWIVSVLAGGTVEADVERALRFDPAGERGPALQVVSIETQAKSASAIEHASALAPRAMTMAFEVPLAPGRHERCALLAAVKAAGRVAKIRTGGVTADAIPSPALVAEFIWDCARAGVPFKATAGLHHPVRAEQRLTYASDSPRATMHGFVNVLLASVAAWTASRQDGAADLVDPPDSVTGILEERDAASFRLDGSSIRWRRTVISATDVARARGGLVRSFGSCSFVEPLDGLEAMGWLSRP